MLPPSLGEDMPVAIWVGLIGGVSGVTGAVISAIYARRLAGIQSELQEQRDARKARSDYEYEARKRLYSVYEPMKFQLVELIGQALRRISALSLAAPEIGTYEQVATIYELLAPAALVRMLDRNLTLADMHLEPQVSIEYGLIKAAYRVLADSSSLTSINSAVSGVKSLDGLDGVLHPYQLDGAADALLSLIQNDGGAGNMPGRPDRLLTLSQFGTLLADADALGGESGLGPIALLLTDFTPSRRPVFWQALVTQVLLYGCYLDLVLTGQPIRSDRLQNLAASLLPQLEGAVNAGLRLDKHWMSKERPAKTEVNAQAVLDVLPCASLYYQLRVLSALDLGTIAPGQP
jgi:hypothetical protein